ncbi:response regulator receiver [Gelatoporia subvermispora B]|uniref:Response regulator receiver n=1 Tax=Ceriporiopsis subvermispora (strain B) TaxID=914234 RepID=M2RQ83_CERS8|nr:response regulator receiver [Gelatoporia subvermispora B]
MSGANLPAVRLPTVIAGQGVDEDNPGRDSVVVELPPSNKFGFAWPAESSPTVNAPLTVERPSAVSLSSSDGETDMSDEEASIPVKRTPRPEDSDDSEFITPTNHLHSDQNPMDQQPGRPPLAPRLSRAFSMPLPSQLGPLQNPRRAPSSHSSEGSPEMDARSLEFGLFHELSLELADSVQMVIQTLLQLSPPQVLDPAKEQFAACSLSIPTPSIASLFTSMKNLNYMSANMPALSIDSPSPRASSPVSSPDTPHSDFDVGEMLQSVGDALSGVAAHAGVDIVLFHGDLGMKHVAVKGDESGLSYTLTHVVRQVISTAYRGDTIEIGLYIEGADTSHEAKSGADSPDSPTAPVRSSPVPDPDEPLRCTFYIAHRFLVPEGSDPNMLNVPDPDIILLPPPSRPEPSFKTLILRRLLRHVGASLDVDIQSRHSFVGRPCELSIVLDRGSPSVVDHSTQHTPEDANYHGYPEFRIANEPSLQELIQFAESLRGKKVTLFANSKGSFAQHMTSYLTAWGLDVSHVSTESESEVQAEVLEGSAETASASTLTRDELPPPELHQAPSTTSTAQANASALSFILIDDDVAVLRDRLSKVRAEQAYPLTLHSRKRPSLASNHRPRSSPQVARVMGMTTHNQTITPQNVIVHFTSLSNFKLVKDAIQSILLPVPSAPWRVPEVIVVPKPAGPRRLLTALHTAVTKPVVDPFFSPIATSPMSPGYPAMSPFFNMGAPAKSPGARSTASIRTASDRSARSPKDVGGDYVSVAPSSPLGMSDGMEYFSDAAMKLGASPASGLVIQSPDGQPAGIFFHPQPRSKQPTPSPKLERDRGSLTRNRGVSFHRAHDVPSTPTEPAREPTKRSPRSPPSPVEHVTDSREALDNTPTAGSSHAKGKARQASVSEDVNPVGPILASVSGGLLESASETSVTPPARLTIRKTDTFSRVPSSPPLSPQSRATGGPPTRRSSKRPTAESHMSAPGVLQKKGKATDGNIVPPISVLIVDDNPINQTILSTFMKKKKIKYDVAKNGEEAVQKWRTGNYHLILMDIQMPVMDGIQATKEIRRMEKNNGAVGFPSTPQSEGQSTPSEASASGTSAGVSTPYRSSVIIVALTASSLQSDRVAALAAGCNDFLTKPVSLQWLNSKIIEWGSIKALQMWADIRPDVVKSISHGQAVQAQDVARRLHVPEGRSTPTAPRSRSSSTISRSKITMAEVVGTPLGMTASILRGDKTVTPNTPFADDSPNSLTDSLGEVSNGRAFGPAATLAKPEAAPADWATPPPDGASPDRVGATSDHRVADVVQPAPDDPTSGPVGEVSAEALPDAAVASRTDAAAGSSSDTLAEVAADTVPPTQADSSSDIRHQPTNTVEEPEPAPVAAAAVEGSPKAPTEPYRDLPPDADKGGPGQKPRQ